MTAIEQARVWIAQIRGLGDIPGAFTHVRAGELADQLALRIESPHLINQGQSPFCVPASMVYGLAKSNADTYVKFVYALFRHGQAHLKSWHVKPSRTVLTSDSFRRLGIAAADWIPTVSIRNADNFLLPLGLPIPGISEKLDFEGLDIPRTVLRLQEAAYTHVTYNRSATIQSVRLANSWYRQNYIVSMSINSKLLTVAPSRLPPPDAKHNHRVVLTSPIQIFAPANEPYHVKFSAFSWGRSMPVPPVTVRESRNDHRPQEKLLLSKFLENYNGFVAFKY